MTGTAPAPARRARKTRKAAAAAPAHPWVELIEASRTLVVSDPYSADGEDTTADLTLDQLAAPAAAYGRCDFASTTFEFFGVPAEVESWRWTIEIGRWLDHHATVLVDESGEEWIVDWTWPQFADERWAAGKSAAGVPFPLVEPLDDYRARVAELAARILPQHGPRAMRARWSSSDPFMGAGLLRSVTLTESARAA